VLYSGQIHKCDLDTARKRQHIKCTNNKRTIAPDCNVMKLDGIDHGADVEKLANVMRSKYRQTLSLTKSGTCLQTLVKFRARHHSRTAIGCK